MVFWNGVKDEETLMKYLEKGLISNTVEMVLACKDSHSSECSCPYDFCCESIRSTVLTLRLKREFYEAVERGDKLIEYRDATPYWEVRMRGKKFVRFFLGYPPRTVEPIIRLIEKVVCVGDQYHIHLVKPD